MRYLSLFSGIGGMDEGFRRAGWEAEAFVEFEDDRAYVLHDNFPNVPRYRDVRTFDPSGITVDALVGGFPCQPHSVGGRRRGVQDERYLWPDFFRVLKQLDPRPRWVVPENVPGIRTTAADEVISDLESEGYTCWPLVVGADDFGAPHERKRVFFVAYSEQAGLSRRVGGARIPLPAQASYAERGDSMAGTWRGLATDRPALPVDDGLSVGMARKLLPAIGDAVQVEVAEAIGRAIIRVDNAIALAA